MVKNASDAPRFRIVVLLMISAFVGRIFCIGSSFAVVGNQMNQPDNYDYDSRINTRGQQDASVDRVLLHADDRSIYHTDVNATDTDDKPIHPTDDNATHTEDKVTQTVGKVHVIYGLSGNTTNFISEFYISLKSVLMNAPVDMGMSVHVLADEKAYNALEKETADRIKLDTLVSRQQISIEIYNLEGKRKQWQRRIIDNTGHWLSKKHTYGTYFRLFAPDVLPSDAEHVIYLDTDAVVFSNLQELWKLRNATSLFQWGIDSRCAGFMILNIREMRLKFWNMVNSTYEKTFKRNANDQQIFRHIQRHFPEYVSSLPKEWDNHRADNFHKLGKRSLLKNRPKMGMLHFNGGGGADTNVYEERTRTDFSVVPYIANHPWQWVGFMLQSQVPPGMPGYPVVLNMTVL